MATKDEILAELARRGLQADTGGAATPPVAAPAGATPPAGKLPPGMLDALSARAGQQGGTGLGDVAGEFGSAWGRSVLDKSADTINTVTTPARAIANTGLELAGSSRRVPEVPQIGSQLFPGGQMAPGAERERVIGAGENIPVALSFMGGAGVAAPKRLQAALSRGAARVPGGGPSGAGAVRGAKPRVQIQGGQPVGPVPPTPPPPKPSFASRWLKQPAAGGAVGAGVAEATGGDPMKGALYGMAFNNPMGRWGMSRIAKAALGDKARVMTYLGSHPATRRSVKRLSKALAKKLEEK